MILEGLMAVLQPFTIVLIAVGVVVGIIFGSIPGLTATMAIVMFLPATYSMTASQGISMLMALYIGGISGGLISAILLNIPGTPSSVATVFDGGPMAKKGQAGKAREIAGRFADELMDSADFFLSFYNYRESDFESVFTYLQNLQYVYAASGDNDLADELNTRLTNLIDPTGELSAGMAE